MLLWIFLVVEECRVSLHKVIDIVVVRCVRMGKKSWLLNKLKALIMDHGRVSYG